MATWRFGVLNTKGIQFSSCQAQGAKTWYESIPCTQCMYWYVSTIVCTVYPNCVCYVSISVLCVLACIYYALNVGVMYCNSCMCVKQPKTALVLDPWVDDGMAWSQIEIWSNNGAWITHLESAPPYVHLSSTWCHSRDEFTQAFPIFGHSSASIYYC